MPTSTFCTFYSRKIKSHPILTILSKVYSFCHQMSSCAKNDKNLPSSLLLGINGSTQKGQGIRLLLRAISQVLGNDNNSPAGVGILIELYVIYIAGAPHITLP